METWWDIWDIGIHWWCDRMCWRMLRVSSCLYLFTGVSWWIGCCGCHWCDCGSDWTPFCFWFHCCFGTCCRLRVCRPTWNDITNSICFCWESGVQGKRTLMLFTIWSLCWQTFGYHSLYGQVNPSANEKNQWDFLAALAFWCFLHWNILGPHTWGVRCGSGCRRCAEYGSSTFWSVSSSAFTCLHAAGTCVHPCMQTSRCQMVPKWANGLGTVRAQFGRTALYRDSQRINTWPDFFKCWPS